MHYSDYYNIAYRKRLLGLLISVVAEIVNHNDVIRGSFETFPHIEKHLLVGRREVTHNKQEFVRNRENDVLNEVVRGLAMCCCKSNLSVFLRFELRKINCNMIVISMAKEQY